MSLVNRIKNIFIKPTHITLDEVEGSFFDESSWHYKKSAIDFSVNNQVIQLKSKADQISYVNFLAAGTNFSRIEAYQNKVTLHERNTILLKGKAEKGLTYIIYLIEYNEQNKQVKKHNLRLHEMKSFTKQKDTVAARLAIRISGKGKMELNSIFTSPFIPIPSLKKEQVTDLKEIRIAGILSEDAMTSLIDISSPYALSVNTWQEVLEINVPDFVLLEVQKLTDEAWGNGAERTSPISRLLLWCRTSDIKVILWHRQKEIAAQQFAAISEKADVIITHQAGHAEFYKEQTLKERVALTPEPIRPQPLESTVQEQKLEKNRSILWRNNPKDFICFLLKKMNIKYESIPPTLTMYVTAHTKEEFHQAIQTIESQTLKNVKWILFIMPFEGYVEEMNPYMEKIEIHIHSYVLKHRFFRDMVPTTHFGILHRQHIQNEFFLEDVIHWLDYQPSAELEILDESHHTTATFYLKEKYTKKRLKELIPLKGEFSIAYDQHTHLS